jgi:phosphate transport system substrate-binding protein
MNFAAMTGYPLATVSYAIVCQSYSDSAVGDTVKAFFTYAVTDGQQFASQLAFAPLPAGLVTKDEQTIDSIG